MVEPLIDNKEPLFLNLLKTQIYQQYDGLIQIKLTDFHKNIPHLQETNHPTQQNLLSGQQTSCSF